MDRKRQRNEKNIYREKGGENVCLLVYVCGRGWERKISDEI